MMNLRTKIIGLSVVLLFALTCLGHAARIKGVRFADTVIVDQAQLELRGMAVLKWAMLFNVYAGAFYLPPGYPGKDWDDDVPRRLELAYFREIKGSDFAESSDHLLRNNLKDAEYRDLAERLQELYRLFRDVKPGDRYSLNYTPGRGTELRLNEKPLGLIPGADFAVAYFGIWLGTEPIDKKFRDRLLGI